MQAHSATGFCAPLALWEYQARHNGKLPDELSVVSELDNIATSLLAKAEVNKQAMSAVPHELIEYVRVGLIFTLWLMLLSI